MKAFILTVCVLLGLVGPVWAITPVDGSASPATKALLTYLDGLKNRTDKRLITGQWGDWNGMNQAALDRMQRIFNLSGQRPALWGVLSYKAATGPPCLFTLSTSTPNLIDHWVNGGGLVWVDLWPPNPFNGRCASDEGPTGQHDLGPTPANMYTENGNAMNVAFRASLDQIAVELVKLQNAGVVVICRCMAEMNQPFFWWGRLSNSQYIAMWKYAQNYLVNIKNIHNLLWLYSPFDAMGSATEWQGKYPGNTFVDMVGIDFYGVYTPRPQPRYNAAGKHFAYDGMTALGKPFWAAELGCQQYGDAPAVDLNACYNLLKTAMPLIIGSMNWNENWAIDFNTNVNAAMNNPWVQNRPVPRAPSGDTTPPGPPTNFRVQ